MSVYETEEEQIESFKKWWKENGTSVIAGLVIGLGGVFGWQAWNNYQDSQGEAASVAFEQMMGALTQGEVESASKQAELLRLDYPSTPYADFAALAQAKVKLEQGDSAAARAQLEWVMKNTGDSGLEQIARLRLARIVLSEGNLDQATGLVNSASESFAAEFAEIRGDIAVSRGDFDQARQAYRKALDLGAGNTPLIEVKLDNLGSPNS